MDVYHIWCDLQTGVRDTEFVRAVHEFLGALRKAGKISAYRILRKKLGLAPTGIGDFHIMIEVQDLAALDAAFRSVARRADPVESQHFAVNSLVQNLQFALYRDFPDAVREEGSEKF